MPFWGFPMVSSFINFYDEVYRSYMDTNHVEFVNASPMPSSIPVIPAKDERDIRSSQRPKALFNLASSSKWGWQDALYLFILLLSVVAMARYFTPDFTGEVAGMWWDPLLNMWTLSWDTTTLLHAPTHLWQAQLLYPNNLTLTYSENLLGEAIFFAPFFLATHNPVLAYNVTFYLAFLLCGINMYIVARHYTGKSLAALVAALIYAFSPYRIGQIDHIHIVAGEWIPLALLYLDLSFQNGRWRHWSLFALFYFLQVLSSIYYGIFLSYTLLAFILIRYSWPFLSQSLQKGRVYLLYILKQALKPTVVFTISFIILDLLLAPYFAIQRQGLARTLSETAAFSAFVRDFGFTAPFNWLYGIHFYNGVPFRNDSEHYLAPLLFRPGFAVCRTSWSAGPTGPRTIVPASNTTTLSTGFTHALASRLLPASRFQGAARSRSPHRRITAGAGTAGCICYRVAPGKQSKSTTSKTNRQPAGTGEGLFTPLCISILACCFSAGFTNRGRVCHCPGGNTGTFTRHLCTNR